MPASEVPFKTRTSTDSPTLHYAHRAWRPVFQQLAGSSSAVSRARFADFTGVISQNAALGPPTAEVREGDVAAKCHVGHEHVQEVEYTYGDETT